MLHLVAQVRQAPDERGRVKCRDDEKIKEGISGGDSSSSSEELQQLIHDFTFNPAAVQQCLHVLSMFKWIFCGFSSFLSNSPDLI